MKWYFICTVLCIAAFALTRIGSRIVMTDLQTLSLPTAEEAYSYEQTTLTRDVGEDVYYYVLQKYIMYKIVNLPSHAWMVSDDDLANEHQPYSEASQRSFLQALQRHHNVLKDQFDAQLINHRDGLSLRWSYTPEFKRRKHLEQELEKLNRKP